MDCMYDSPRWSWQIQEQHTLYGVFASPCRVVVDGQVRTSVHLTPPGELIRVLLALGAESASCSVHIKGKSGRMVLLYTDSTGTHKVPLFRFTRSTAPSWLKRMMTA